MTRIDFYVLPGSEEAERLIFASRLIEKALHQGHRLLVALEYPDQARELERALLEHRPEAYLPYRHFDDEDKGEPITLNTGYSGGDHHDILINLGATIPDYFSRFQRCIEIATQETAVLERTREHWTFYKDRGYPIKHHRL